MKRPKRKRAQPRKATPPVAFRSEEGERTILMLDESFVTLVPMQTTSRTPLFLRLAPGLRVTLHSRRVMKKRHPELRIESTAA